MLTFNRLSGQKSGTVVIAFAVLLCAIFILHALTLWGGYGSGQKGDLKSVEQVRSFNKQTARDFDTGEIVGKNLFASSLSAANPAAEIRTSASKLKLEAIFENTNQGQSKAIVSNNGEPGKTYGEGAEIAPGIRIERIERQQLVINNQGRREALQFPKQRQQSAPVFASRAVASARDTKRVAQASAEDEDTLTDAEYSQLIAELPAEEQRKIAPLNKERNLGKLINAVSENEKIKLVTQRLEQLRRKSRNR